MKNFTLLLLFITGVAFTSCKKDPDEKATDNIIGKWYMQSYSEKHYKNGTLINQQNSSTPSETMTVEFKSNGVGFNNHGDQFKYKVSGSKLIITYDDEESEEQTIKKLTSSEMTIYGEDSWEEGSDKYSSTYEENLKKK